MSETRFVAAYTIPISDVAEQDLLDKLDEWNIPCHEDDCNLMEAPWAMVSDGEDRVLQVVLVDEPSYGGEVIAFSPDKAQAVLQKIHSEHTKLFEFIFRHGYCNLYPVAYTYYTGSDEPVVM